MSLGDIPIFKRSWNALTGRQQSEREKALEVKRKMLQGIDHIIASRQAEISWNIARRHLGDIVKVSRSGKVRVKKDDHISRSMIIYTSGRVQVITVNDSEQASIIGRYMNAVQIYLNTGDAEILLEFEGIEIIDENGQEYELETDPEIIEDIEGRVEDREIRKIYAGGS